MSEEVDVVTRLPCSCRFFNAVIDTLHRSHGIMPVAQNLCRYISDSGRFDQIYSHRFAIPIGDWHENPVYQRLGLQYRSILELYADSMGVMMVQAGKSEAEVNELVRSYVDELYTVSGLVSHYYVVQARRV